MARIDDKAKQMVGAVAVVGTVLAGAGLVATGQLRAGSAAYRLAAVSAGLAFCSVFLALFATVLRFEASVAHRDLVAVRAWYDRQFRRAKLVVAAGVILLVAVALAGAAAVVQLVSPGVVDPTLQLTAAAAGPETIVSAVVGASDLRPGSVVTAELATTGGAGGSTVIVIARAGAVADGDGRASVKVQARAPGAAGVFQLTAVTADRRCFLRLGDPALTSEQHCTTR